MAAGPATKPVVLAPTTPVGPRERPTLIDARQPAFVPKFAQVNNPPAGRFEERQYAYRYTYPGPFNYGSGYGSYGYGHHGWAYGHYGFGRGGWGSWGGVQVQFR